MPPLPGLAEETPGFAKLRHLGKSPDSTCTAKRDAKEDKATEFWEVTQRTLIKVPSSAKRGRHFKLGGILGMGGFATVFLVYHVAKRKEVAIKCIKYTQGFPRGSCRGILNELKVLAALAEQRIQSRFLLGPYLGYDLWAWRSSKGYLHILTVRRIH